MATIVLLATAWGTKGGGINSFNLDCARALGAELGSRGQSVCVVPATVTKEVVDQALAEGVKLVSLGMDAAAEVPPSFDPLWSGTVLVELRKQGVGQVDWYVGHDVVSGAAANVLRDQTERARSAVFVHMSYRDYQGLKHGSAQEAQRKYKKHDAALNAIRRAAEVLRPENERRPLALREITRRVAETHAELSRMIPPASTQTPARA